MEQMKSVKRSSRKKAICRAAAIIFLCLVFACPAYALEDITRDARAAAGALDKEDGQAVREMTPEDATVDQGIENIIEAAKNQGGGIFKKTLSQMLPVLAIVILCCMTSSFVEKQGIDFVNIGGVLGIAALTLGNVNSLMQSASDAINRLAGFNTLLLPTIASATAAMGAPTTSIARHTATVFFSSLLSNLFDKLMMPMLYAYFGLITVNAAMPKDILERMASLVKWCLTGLMTALVFAFISYLTLTGAIAGSADALAVKSLKTAVSTALPVVGGIISDASETVIVGAGVIKNSIGIFGLFAVLGIFLTPFLELGIRHLIFKLTGALSVPLAGEKLGKYIEGVSGVFGLALGMVGAVAVLNIISITSFILISGAG